MYQTCTNTAANHGEQRTTAVNRNQPLNRPNAPLPAATQVDGKWLITRRAQVQILPPPPTEDQLRGPFWKSGKGLWRCRTPPRVLRRGDVLESTIEGVGAIVTVF
jgi:hypothetical protein